VKAYERVAFLGRRVCPIY